MNGKSVLKKTGLVLVVLLITILTGCGAVSGFDRDINSITEPYDFSIVKWELSTLVDKVKQGVSWGGGINRDADEVGQVEKYFSTVETVNNLKSEIEAIETGQKQGNLTRLKANLRSQEWRKLTSEGEVGRILEKQIRETLSGLGIFHPLDRYLGLRVSFPPINFALAPPPYLLVISSREKIETVKEVTLKQDITVDEMELIEEQADRLGVSSLVVKLGGFGGTYPTFVTNDTDMRFTIDTAVEEWLHQYLTFTPLGFRYALHLSGILRDYDIVTLNETVASMVSKEIGSLVYDRYYTKGVLTDNPSRARQSGFNFNQEMRDIRKTVDAYLAEGEIEQAESYMKQKRQYLYANGYRIRKLNQAYFAFHGVYGDSPTSVSPIGSQLRELRKTSASVKEFLDTVVSLTTSRSLADTLKENGK